MPYFPKQSINYRDASPGEFIYKNTQQPYEGPIMETNTGKFYPGSDPKKAEIELIKAESLQSVQFGFNRHTQLYNIQKLPIFEKKKQQLKPGASKIGPSETDYKRGYYNRFYMYRTNSTSMITEISEKSYKDILDRKIEIDTNLYKVGQFKWALKGELSAINFLASIFSFIEKAKDKSKSRLCTMLVLQSSVVLISLDIIFFIISSGLSINSSLSFTLPSTSA